MDNKENHNQDSSIYQFNSKGKHEMGREVGIDYRGLIRLKERLTKGKPRKRDRMF